MSAIYSFPSAFNRAVIVPGRHALNTTVDSAIFVVDAALGVMGQGCRTLYLDKIGAVAFRFFRSYGNAPKDLAKVICVVGTWTAAICGKRGAFDGQETAKKVSAFAKQAKCFLSFAGIWKQSANIFGDLAVFRARTQEPNEPLIEFDERPDHDPRDHFLINIFTVPGLKAIINNGSAMCSTIFESVSLFSVLGLVSSKTRFFEVMRTGNCVATILGASLRFGGEGYQLRGQYGQRRLRSTSALESTVKLIEHAAVLALGGLPLTPWFKNSSGDLRDRVMLGFSTAAVITNLFHKHIPASLGFQQAANV